MSKSLWDFYDGEPFMENPHLAIVGANPRSKKGKRNMAARRKGRKNASRRGRKNAPRRKAAKRNFPSAGLVFNPRGRKRNAKRRSRKNPVHHAGRRRTTHRRNPALLGVTLPPVAMIAWGAGGFIAPPMVEGFVNKFLPASVTSSILGRYAVKIGSVLGLTFLVKHLLGQKEAFPVAMGGSLYVVVSAVNEFAPQLTAPPAGTAAYRSGMIKAYRNGMISTGVGAYTDGMGRSLPGLAGSMPGLAQPSQDMAPFDLLLTGMTNPVFADPRFVGNGQVPR